MAWTRVVLISTQVVVARVIGDHSARIQSLPADQQARRRGSGGGREGALEGRVEGASCSRGPDPAAPVTPEDAMRRSGPWRPRGRTDGSLSDEAFVRSEQEGASARRKESKIPPRLRQRDASMACW